MSRFAEHDEHAKCELLTNELAAAAHTVKCKPRAVAIVFPRRNGKGSNRRQSATCNERDGPAMQR
jgi:hypothetical protein